MRFDSDLVKLLVAAGLTLLGLAGIIALLGHFGVSRMPGDVVIERPGWKVYIPLGWCLVLSVGLSLLMWLLRR